MGKKNNSFTTIPIPFETYFDPEVLDLEIDSFFSKNSKYLGHKLMIPKVGDYSVLEHEGSSRFLINNSSGFQIISNICKHRQATMLEGTGNIKSIICPLHNWAYDLTGNIIGTPKFKKLISSKLESKNLSEWNGLLFENDISDLKRNLQQNPYKNEFSFNGYKLNKVDSHVCEYNWKTFIEVYLDDYHVDPYHNGLSSFVDCSDLNWHFFDHFSVQTVGISKKEKKTTPIYKRWKNAVKNSFENLYPNWGAIWMLIYPNVMLEWYPNTIVISSLYPISTQKTLNITEFYYPEKISLFNKEFINSQQAAYNQTVLEDDKIAIKIENGRRELIKSNKREFGPFHPELEAGIPHFYNYLKNKANKKLKEEFYETNYIS